MNKKISDKDKLDWESFIKNKDKVPNKDIFVKKNSIRSVNRTIDLHGYTLEKANKIIDEFINSCYRKRINKIIVITGKGLRSTNVSNPYVSKNLSILKYSVPEFIESNKELMKMIIKITDANIEDGGSGAFYIYLKNILRNK
ncbi:Smr/MutS family protein [Candidatus Pelagibacter sp.]|nr:Smr/MutS family protein [Candidatus Pelagibacter sp.]